MMHSRSDERDADLAAQPRAYHHGALPDALIAAAEGIIAEKGVEGFTLRECARRAGVSPAAPAHHFGDVSGLLTAVATRGFQALTAALEAGNKRGVDPASRLREQGVGYVSFALTSPGAFKLIFRRDRLDCNNSDLNNAARGAFSQLETAVRDLRHSPPGALDQKTYAAVIAAWSLVHGFAHLAVDGEFDRFSSTGGRDTLLTHLLPAVLNHLPESEELNALSLPEAG